MCNQKHRQITTTQVITASANLMLQDIAEIRDGRIRSIWLRRSGSATLLTRLGTTVAADTVIDTAHLTLVNQKTKQVMVIPLSTLQRDYNAPEPFAVDPDVYDGIDLSRSTITLSTSAAGYNATHAIEIMFEYECR